MKNIYYNYMEMWKKMKELYYNYSNPNGCQIHNTCSRLTLQALSLLSRGHFVYMIKDVTTETTRYMMHRYIDQIYAQDKQRAVIQQANLYVLESTNSVLTNIKNQEIIFYSLETPSNELLSSIDSSNNIYYYNYDTSSWFGFDDKLTTSTVKIIDCPCGQQLDSEQDLSPRDGKLTCWKCGWKA